MGKYFYPRHRLGTLAFIVVLSVYCTKPPAAEGTQEENKPAIRIPGVVINSLTHEPIGRALVFSPDNRFATMTDSEGRFEFTFAPAETDPTKDDKAGSTNSGSTMTTCTGGTCTTYSSPNGIPNRLTTVMARKPGFLDDHSPQPITEGTEVTIALTPEALVIGRVVLPTSEASDTIELELYRRQVQDGRAHWVRTDGASTKSNGEFRFAELSAGSYKLLTRELLDRDPLVFDPRGQLYGYPPVYFPNATDFAAAQTIQLTAGQIFQADISLVRHAYYPVKVAVANAPPGGVNIVVSAQGHRGPGFALGYNERQQVIEGLLPNGNYTLEASGFGANPASGLVNISVKGAAVEGSRVTMVPNGSIGVNVKEEFTSSQEQGGRNFVINGRNQRGPRGYLNVRLEPADDFGQERVLWLRPPAVPGDDSLAVEGVPPGRYWVRVDTSRGFVASITSGSTDLEHHLLVVGQGGSSSSVDITMRDAGAEMDGTIEGAPRASESPAPSVSVARLATDGPFAHVYCVPLPDSSGEYKDIWVAPDGTFNLPEMPPGTYRVLAFDHPQPELEYRNPEAMSAYDAKGQVVRLVAGQKEHLQLQLISTSE